MTKKIIYLFLFTATIFAQRLTNKEIEDFFSVKYLGNPTILSSSGKIIFTVSSTNLSLNKMQTGLWIKEINSSKQPVQLLFPVGSCGNLSVTRDEKVVYFTSDINPYGIQIYSLPVTGGKPSEVFRFPTSIQKFSLNKNEDKIYFIAEDTLTTDEHKKNDEKWDAYLFEDNRKFSSLWEFDFKTKKFSQLSFGFQIKAITPSPDGTKIALLGASTPNFSDESSTEIYIYDVVLKKTHRVTNNNVIEKQIEWGKNNSYLTFIAAANEKLEPYYQETIFKLDIQDQKITGIIPKFNYQVMKQGIDITGNKIYFTANEGVTQQLFVHDLNTNQTKELTQFKGVIKDFVCSFSKKIMIVQNTDPATQDEFYFANIGSGIFKKVFNPNPPNQKENLPGYQTIEWKSWDGTTIQGILITPKNYDKKKSYPLIVQLHGGPNSSFQLNYGSHWSIYPSVLTSRGYIVFQPNYRGSTGYGNNFMRGMIGDFFKLGTEDILSGVEFLTKSGAADKDRIAVMGWSAGGHFTNWLITQTEIFKAAISLAGLSNWISFYSQTEVPYLREIWLEGIPYSNISSWMNQSPISHVEKVKTPTLFECGELDRRVPLPQSIEMYRALKRLDIPTKMLIFPREYHSLDEPHHQIQKMNADLDWLEKYLKL